MAFPWVIQQVKNILLAVADLTSGITDLTGVVSDLTGVVNNKANLNSPAFTGIPTSPTAATNTNSNQLATTAFVHNLETTRYGVCNTPSETQSKIVTIPYFVRKTGAIIAVKFTNGSSVANSYLTINNDAATMMTHRGAYLTSGMIPYAYVALFQFNGSEWELLNPASEGGLSTLEIITVSGTFTAIKTGAHRVTCIGGGGGGGGSSSTSNVNTNGARGGSTSFSSITALGGVGGGAGANIRGGGGGGAGNITTDYVYLTTGQTVTVTIGAGGTSIAGGSTAYTSGIGAKGAESGKATTGIGGSTGGSNHTGYGEGGDGYGTERARTFGTSGAVKIEY